MYSSVIHILVYIKWRCMLILSYLIISRKKIIDHKFVFEKMTITLCGPITMGGNRSDALLRAASEKLHHHKWFFHWNEVEGIKGIFSSTWDQRERTCANKTENTLKEVELSLSIVIGYIDGPFEKWMHAIAEPVLSFHWVSSFSLQMSENWEKDLNGYFS